MDMKFERKIGARVGHEPTIFTFPGRCSYQLSYRAHFSFQIMLSYIVNVYSDQPIVGRVYLCIAVLFFCNVVNEAEEVR